MALEVALRLKRATTTDAESARVAFLRFFEDEAREHFRAEEELLLPVFARHVPADDPDVVRVLVEHVELHRGALDLAAGTDDTDVLHALGELLERHVRHEERTLFPRIEAALSADDLASLGATLGAAGNAHRPPRR